MLLFRILKKDLSRKKTVSVILFFLLFFSSVLVSTGLRHIVILVNSLNSFITASKTPDFLQMHAGSLDRDQLDSWVLKQTGIRDHAVVSMLSVDSSRLLLNDSEIPDGQRIMDISFVTQNERFDFLLDMNNVPIQVEQGQLAVPAYYVEKELIKTGEFVTVLGESGEFRYEVGGIARDSLMNPALIHSKRFVMHPDDFAVLERSGFEQEFLIEFLLDDSDAVQSFAAAYASSGLPQNGPAIEQSLILVFNAISDGILTLALLLLSSLSLFIAFLCVRFAVMSALEEDLPDTGIMKAVGVPLSVIRLLFALKYLFSAALACTAGFLCSFFMGPLTLKNLALYTGLSDSGDSAFIAGFSGTLLIFLFVLLSCRILLRRIGRIRVMDALRYNVDSASVSSIPFPRFSKISILPVNIYLGFRDVFQRFRIYALELFIFFFCTCLIILPVHFYTTMSSPDFIRYMGISRSDIRMDLRYSPDIEQRYHILMEHLSQDRDVHSFNALRTSRYTVLLPDGSTENLHIENGDFSDFPLEYLIGNAPDNVQQIALSYMSSQSLDLSVGENLTLLIDDKAQTLQVCGIYQDVSNGGTTAKAMFPDHSGQVLWYVINMNLEEAVSRHEKIREYEALFSPIRINDMDSYVHQTLGGTIAQLRLIITCSIILGLGMAVLICALFLSMLGAKDHLRNAILRALGFSLSDIRLQYICSIVLIIISGVFTGTVFSNCAGEGMLGFFMSFMGAPQIQLIIKPLFTVVLLPLLLILSVILCALVSIHSFRTICIAEIIKE